MIAGPQASAASRTSFDFLSEAAVRTLGRKGTMNGSALLPIFLQISITAFRAASDVSRSLNIFLSLSTTPHSEKARTPAALMRLANSVAATPASAPFARTSVSKHCFISSEPLINVSFIVAVINSTLSKEFVFGRPLRPSNEFDFCNAPLEVMPLAVLLIFLRSGGRPDGAFYLFSFLQPHTCMRPGTVS